MIKSYKNILAAIITTLICGCSGSYKPQLFFNPGEPIRIAVLPFAQVDSAGKIVEGGDPNLLIDNVALVSSKLKQTPVQFARDLVQSELAQASLDIVPPPIVDALLHHSVYEIPGSRPLALDVARIMRADPKEICTKILSCDAVLYGKVTRWDRSYYGIQSVATVGLNLRLVSAKTGKLLFETTAEDSDSRGLTKGPTGFSNLVLEPLQGLDNEIITDLARNMVSKAVAPLSGRDRPEFLSTPAPIVIAASHSARAGGVIQNNGRLIVVVYGSPGMLGSFDIGSEAQGIPLVERSKGHYVGEFVPLNGESFSNQVVSTSLRDKAGRVTTTQLTKRPVSYR
jgi:hypothetical protein